ncbi:MAG: hypothetical protein IPL22_13015 [Bacteroidetes bacterium]|nr:hypothetical protein [Bacteroidota bacterium]
MNFRTLNREATLHLMIVSSMVLAWGVTSFYFDSKVNNEVLSIISGLLLSPVYLFDNILNMLSDIRIIGDPFKMFMLLWVIYLFPAMRLCPLLIVRDHHSTDLKNWYESRFSK